MEKLLRKIESDELDTFEVLNNAQEQGRVIASLVSVDKHVLETRDTIRTGTLMAYAKDAKTPIGAEVEYSGLRLVVPKKFQGVMGDHALVVDHPEFKLDGKVITITDESKVRVEKIHRKDGWYGMDSNMLPTGTPSNSDDKSARRFWQCDDEAYVGLLVRLDFFFWRYVIANYGPDYRFGVLLEDKVPQAPKIKA